MNISNTKNVVLMQQARENLKNKWGPAIGVAAILIVFNVLSEIPNFGFFIFLLVIPNLYVGAGIFFLSISRNKEANFNQLFESFQDSRFGTAIGAYILMILCIILGFICLIIPGIILCYAFSMTFWILAEDKQIGPHDALKKSYNMMKGNKWKYFCLTCRFIGWLILSILTFGLGFLWLTPYYYVSSGKFYDDIIKNDLNEIKEDLDELKTSLEDLKGEKNKEDDSIEE